MLLLLLKIFGGETTLGEDLFCIIRGGVILGGRDANLDMGGG